MESNAKELAQAYLESHNVLTLATEANGDLWAAAVFYVNDGWDLYFLSAETTRHAQNVSKNSRIAGTIQEDYKDWPEIKGIQLDGEAVKLEDGARDRAISLYLKKYPYVAESEVLRAAMERVGWWMIRPKTLYFIDNSKGLGHRDLILSRSDGSFEDS